MTVKRKRSRRKKVSASVATRRRSHIHTRRLAKLVEFAQTELTAEAADRWARELPEIRLSGIRRVLPAAPKDGELTPVALLALQREVLNKLDNIVSFPDAPLVQIEIRAHQVILLKNEGQLERSILAEWPNSFWIAVVEILEDSGHRLAQCLRPACQRLIVKTRRQQYCSLSCSQMVRSHRWYEAHRPEAQRRRREAYAKEVKAKYPRAKIKTTRPRDPR